MERRVDVINARAEAENGDATEHESRNKVSDALASAKGGILSSAQAKAMRAEKECLDAAITILGDTGPIPLAMFGKKLYETCEHAEELIREGGGLKCWLEAEAYTVLFRVDAEACGGSGQVELITPNVEVKSRHNGRAEAAPDDDLRRRISRPSLRSGSIDRGHAAKRRRVIPAGTRRVIRVGSLYYN